MRAAHSCVSAWRPQQRVQRACTLPPLHTQLPTPMVTRAQAANATKVGAPINGLTRACMTAHYMRPHGPCKVHGPGKAPSSRASVCNVHTLPLLPTQIHIPWTRPPARQAAAHAAKVRRVQTVRARLPRCSHTHSPQPSPAHAPPPPHMHTSMHPMHMPVALTLQLPPCCRCRYNPWAAPADAIYTDPSSQVPYRLPN